MSKKVIELSEKQGPKSPIYDSGKAFCPNENCGNVALSYYSYCPECGQSIMRDDGYRK